MDYKSIALELAEYLYDEEKENATFDYEGDPEDHVFSTICEVLGLNYDEEIEQ